MLIQLAIYKPLCIEVKDAATVEGEIVQTYPCLANEARQQWMFTPAPGGVSGYFIQNVNSGQCMTVSYGSPSTSTPVVQAPCFTPLQTSQVWTYVPTTGPILGYTLVSAVSQLCLDIPDGATAGTTPMQVYTCTPVDPAQAFVLTPVARATQP